MYSIVTRLLADSGVQDYEFEGRTGKYRQLTVRVGDRIVKMRCDVEAVGSTRDMIDHDVSVTFELIGRGGKVDVIARKIDLA